MRKLVIFGTEVLLYCIAAVAFFQGFQIAISNLLDFSFMTMLIPMFGTYWAITYWLFAYHTFLHTGDEEKRKKLLFGNGIGFIAVGLLLLIGVIINMSMGKYYFGLINFLFPIDLILLNLLGIALGVLMLLKKDSIIKLICPIAKEEKMHPALAISKAIGGSLYILVSLYLFGGYLLKYGFLQADREGFGFALLFLALVLVSYIALAYREARMMVDMDKPLERKKRLIIETCFVSLISVLSLVIVIVNFTPAAQYISTCFEPYFILDYIGSVNLAPWLVSVPVTAAAWLNFALFLKKKD